MLCLFEGCVSDEDLALFAPVTWLSERDLVSIFE